jgi:O-antigen ligase
VSSVVNTSAFASARERLALAHAGLVVIASAWLLGGMGPRGEWIVAALAAPAFGLLFSEARARRRAGDHAGLRRLLRWSAPLAALACLVLVSVCNPSHRPAFIYDGYVLRPVAHLSWLPASAAPAGSLRLLACFGGLAATGLSLAFCIQSRRALRRLVLVLALHAAVLAVLGTLQRQSGAAGPFFGAIPARNPTWFATFLYHNHWGAFAVLHAAATLALVFQSLREPPPRGWIHGPGPSLALAALLIAATAPLSSSRSATVLMLVLAVGAALAALRHALRRARSRRGAFLRVGLLGAILLGAGGLVAFQSREIISVRLAATRAQIGALQSGAAGYTRADLYADTWRMAADKPVFGWGLESYGPVFLNYSRFQPGPDGLMNTFVDAHSDWLQSLAELGFVGTALLLLVGLLPLAETLRLRHLSAFAAWLLAGCALVAAYAWVEFPLACPAVVATWWILWFAALRTIQLTPAPSPETPRIRS